MMKSKTPVVPTTISLPNAVERIKYWLKSMSEVPIFKKDPSLIPRALYISFKDIDDLKKYCEQQFGDDKLVGIRVYFGLTPSIEPVTNPTVDLHGLIVPVLKTHHAKSNVDAVHRNLESPDPNDTNIYDFTSPCPAYCDINSELYVQQ